MMLYKASKRMSGPWGGLKRARAEATNAGVLQVSGAAATGCCCPPLALAPHCTVSTATATSSVPVHPSCAGCSKIWEKSGLKLTASPDFAVVQLE